MYAGDVGIVFVAWRGAARRGAGAAVQSLLPTYPPASAAVAAACIPRMNSRVRVRAVRAGVSLYKTAVLSVVRALCFAPPRLKGKETVGGAGFTGRERGGTGACAQTGGYVPVQMSPCGARITVTYEDGNTYSPVRTV